MTATASAELLKSLPDCGVLLIGHGTRDAEGHEEFLLLGRRLAAALSPMPVEISLLELQPPTIPEAWERLVAAGVRQVIAAPLLLFAAGHAKSDIPAELARCATATPGVDWLQSRPLSRCPELIDLVADRWDQEIAIAGADPAQTAVVVLGRGSHDPCAQADLRVLAATVAHRRPVRKVAVAYYAMAQPKLAEVLSAVTADPKIRDVIVHPHLLFQGAIHRAVGEQVAAAADRDRQHRYHVADYLGPDQAVVAGLIRRIHQAAIAGSLADHPQVLRNA